MRLASREFRLLVLAVSGFRAPVESRRPGRTTGVLPTAQRCEYQDSLDRLSLYWPPKNVRFTTCRTPGERADRLPVRAGKKGSSRDRVSDDNAFRGVLVADIDVESAPYRGHQRQDQER